MTDKLKTFEVWAKGNLVAGIECHAVDEAYELGQEHYGIIGVEEVARTEKNRRWKYGS